MAELALESFIKSKHHPDFLQLEQQLIDDGNNMFLYSVSWCNVFSQTRIRERAWDGREEDVSSSVWCNWFLKKIP